MSDTDESRSRPVAPWLVAAALFAIAWLVRALSAAALPDGAWPHALVYKGDVFEWLQSVASARAGSPEFAGLPLRPPGMVWLVDALWPDATSPDVTALGRTWRVVGALVAPLVYATARRDLSEATARAAGVLAAFATGPLLMTGALESETPYLALTTGALAVGALDVRRGAAAGLLHGAACLLRVEHVVFVVLLAGSRALEGRRRAAAALGVGFVVALAPWHVVAWGRARDVLEADAPRGAAAAAALERVEARAADVAWTPEAAAVRDAWPAVVRRTAAAFVADTVRHRGGQRVDVADLAILDEAFGARPRPWSSRFFVSMYGPLNVALSADPSAPDVGFTRGPLDARPPLTGGAARYPPDLVAGLPPSDLRLDYLPHLALFTGRDVSSLDALSVAASPRGLRRVAHAWRGAAMGVGILGLPVGLSGTRGAVDLLVSDGAWATLVAVVAAALAAVGAWRGGAGTRPWTLFVVAKLGTAAVAFGYARFGATAAPAVAVLAAAAVGPLWTHRRVVVLALALLAVDVFVATVGVEATIDGRPVGATDPFPLDDHEPRRVTLEAAWP